jgi:hypothetical protein
MHSVYNKAMHRLNPEQRNQLIDLVEASIDGEPIPKALLSDPLVVGQYVEIADEQPRTTYRFIQGIEPPDVARLTRFDIISEERMLEIHIRDTAFTNTTLVQWLRELDYGGFCFFCKQAAEQNVADLDYIILHAKHSIHVIDGVRVDRVTVPFKTLTTIVDYALLGRIDLRNAQDMVLQLQPTQEALADTLRFLVKKHQALKVITASNQLMPFRLACMLAAFLDDPSMYLQRIETVLMALQSATSIQKFLAFLNTLPYIVIEHMLQKCVANNINTVTDYLSQTLPRYQYGAIRKIVRRKGFELNYKYE